MRILFIDFHKSDGFDFFSNAVISELQNHTFFQASNVTYRRYDNISDLVLNWEFYELNDDSRAIAHAFDKIDIIFISGDYKILPWYTESHDLTTILYMADICSKPVLTCGSGTLASIFSTAVSGKRFEVLNSPIGHSLNYLKLYPQYSSGEVFLSGTWLDNETGDLYKYKTEDKYWYPVTNTGCHRYSTYFNII
jgi:hypothetical protein